MAGIGYSIALDGSGGKCGPRRVHFRIDLLEVNLRRKIPD
jgi:hypothetical protein